MLKQPGSGPLPGLPPGPWPLSLPPVAPARRPGRGLPRGAPASSMEARILPVSCASESPHSLEASACGRQSASSRSSVCGAAQGPPFSALHATHCGVLRRSIALLSAILGSLLSAHATRGSPANQQRPQPASMVPAGRLPLATLHLAHGRQRIRVDRLVPTAQAHSKLHAPCARMARGGAHARVRTSLRVVRVRVACTCVTGVRIFVRCNNQTE
jgi:hypothetical protein